MRTLLMIAVVGGLAIASGFWARRLMHPDPGATLDTERVERLQKLQFELDSLEGKRVASGDLRGRVVVVDFWATWCGPCRLQEKILEALWERYGEQPVSFLAINVGETEEIVRGFVEADPFAYPVLLDPTETLSAPYGIYALPTVMVLDREQGITFLNVGVSSGTQVSAAIDRALALAG
jgi:thiol-disulfide isomerase/thioredoxin